MKTKQTLAAYEAPKVEVIEVKVEQGFAVTGNPFGENGWGNDTPLGQ